FKDPASRIAKPPTTSLVSVNGPSVVDSLPPRRRTRAPSAVGRSPAVLINVPSRVISSMSLPMSCHTAKFVGPGVPGIELDGLAEIPLRRLEVTFGLGVVRRIECAKRRLHIAGKPSPVVHVGIGRRQRD